MSETLSIYQTLARLMFPKGLLDYFTIVGVEEKDIPIGEQQGVESGEIIFYLDEIDHLQHPEEGHKYRPNGFYEPSKVRDFPLRDKKVTLIIRRRRWIDETTEKSVGNTYDLVAKGTRHSVEFAAFLKVPSPSIGNEIKRTHTPFTPYLCFGEHKSRNAHGA